jgi:phenylpropionate dioxygenase-like ring-hydroxylating dioxygenase large terminal subunit
MTVMGELARGELVSAERGEIDRRIFSDQEIFDQEMKFIFGRAWLFVGHESQLREPGDFFEAPMGRDNVLVVRQRDGSIKALLNTCTHRGNAVCRAEEGNVRNFMCTYHGWTFDLAGNLVGVPGFNTFYAGDLDKSKYPLRQVAQLDTYRGFIFATMDPVAPSLPDYLGRMGRGSFDLLAERGDLEVVPGIQKFVIDCNWKIAVDNLFDWYHPQVTHASAFQPGVLGLPPDDAKPEAIDIEGVAMDTGADLSPALGAISGTRFEQVVVVGPYGHGIGGPTADSTGNVEIDKTWRERPEVREALGPVGVNVAGHPSIFPNTWITSAPVQLSLRIPRDPTHTEIWWFTFTDRHLPPDMQAFIANIASRVFGPAGVLEQDDGENWAQATLQTHGVASRRVKHKLSMGLGHGRVIHEAGLARIEGLTSEHGQLWTYRSWSKWLDGLGWEDLAAATTPGDLL